MGNPLSLKKRSHKTPSPCIIENDIVYIQLPHGKFAIVDIKDYAKIKNYNWSLNHGYAARNEGGKTIYLHRLILSPKEGYETDHINRNKLDCRSSNLRICTSKQNQFNKSGKKGISKYKGVSFSAGMKKPWKAMIFWCGKQKNLGFFASERSAASSYNKAAKELFGEFAYLNPV